MWYKRKKVVISAGLLLVLLLLFWFSIPRKLFHAPTSFVIDDNKGQLLGASIASDGQWRFPYNPQVPAKFKACIIAFEDKRFEHHLGIDFIAFGRAMKQNIRARRVVSGGSTLTMQVIRLSTRQNRTFWQKLVEIIKAFRLELTYSKAEILALYASNAPFGSNVVGLDAASWRYFGRSPDKLSWGEMAALAVLPNAPSLVHPGKNRLILLRKRNLLIDRLRRQNVIDATTAKLAKLEPVPDKPFPLPSLAPHLLQRFKTDNASHPQDGGRIRTSIDMLLQQNVAAILEKHHQLLKANDIRNAAAIVLDVETGKTLAYVGNVNHPENRDFESDVDVIAAPRSPGSTLKPLLYAAMMHDGLILPNSLIPDIPTQIGGYHPQNFDLGYDGAVPASKALARSLNIPAVKMLVQYKYDRFHALLRRIGMTTLTQPADHYGLSLILGGGENTLWELSGAYADMARVLNHYHRDKGLYDAADYHNPVYTNVYKSKPELEKGGLLDAGSIYYTFQAMEEVMRPGDELLWQQFSSTQRIAWKTGTSFGFRDGWALGITPRFVVGVWVGNTNGEGRPGLIGVNTAAPIMFEIFRQLPVTRDWFAVPSAEMASIAVCRESGYRAGENCEHIDTLFIPKAGLNAPVCPFHQLVHLDRTRKWQVNSACEAPANMLHVPWFVLPPSMEAYYRTRNYSYKPLPPFRPDCGAIVSRPMEMIYPKDGSKVYVPLEADGTRGRMICNAAHRQPGIKIFWHLDNNYVGETKEYHQLALNPSAGKHVLTLVDANGNRLQTFFEVLQR
ncbi:penicillin-binding protein 1C [Mucilaginibacter sp. RS28]|uniref:peptidoglycan glycosyltransferase n=1 Tax=Mucilaginibacter straminoryzae TaxID=2932774 RepID=A0A9X2BCY4_9SPHI|nr:penicillin-binding protein 1C [Mucilaginibacter straminoryzae]MCJ8209763.1 penicillin-binding protein 1C [Mucilaginibacter straminoryzae]